MNKYITQLITIILISTILVGCKSDKLVVDHDRTVNSNTMSTTESACVSREVDSSVESASSDYSDVESEYTVSEPLPTEQESVKSPSEPTETVSSTDTASVESVITPIPISLQTESIFPELEVEVLKLMNEQRALVGIEPLSADYVFYDCAKTRADECLVEWSHTRPDGRPYYTVFDDFEFTQHIQVVGENLAKKFKTPEQIVACLMASTGHRENILNPNFTQVTICIVPFGEQYYAMSQLFSKRRNYNE